MVGRALRRVIRWPPARLLCGIALFFFSTIAWLIAGDRVSRALNLKRGKDRAASIKAEIAAAQGKHLWAGEYSAGDGLGYNLSLLVAPESGYVFGLVGCLGVYGSGHGTIRQDRGSLLFSGGLKGAMISDSRLVWVRWGPRSYLIPRDEMPQFANYVNLGWEPRFESRGSFLLRGGDEERPAPGKPSVPQEFRALFLDQPFETRIISVGARIPPERWEDEGRLIVTLDAGKRQGAFVGMKLIVPKGRGDARITAVEDRASTAEFDVSGGSQPAVGLRLASRYPGGRDTAVPIKKTIEFLTTRTFPPFHDIPYHASVSGARECGFSVLPVARLRYAAVESQLLRTKGFNSQLDTTLKAIGANVVHIGNEHYRAMANEPAILHATAYRVTYRGQILDWNDFLKSPRNTKTNLEFWQGMRKVMAPLEVARRAARKDAIQDLLRLSPEQDAHFGSLRVEDLTPSQRQAFYDNWGLRSAKGRILDAERAHAADDAFEKLVERAARGKLKARGFNPG